MSATISTETPAVLSETELLLNEEPPCFLESSKAFAAALEKGNPADIFRHLIAASTNDATTTDDTVKATSIFGPTKPRREPEIPLPMPEKKVDMLLRIRSKFHSQVDAIEKQIAAWIDDCKAKSRDAKYHKDRFYGWIQLGPDVEDAFINIYWRAMADEIYDLLTEINKCWRELPELFKGEAKRGLDFAWSFVHYRYLRTHAESRPRVSGVIMLAWQGNFSQLDNEIKIVKKDCDSLRVTINGLFPVPK